MKVTIKKNSEILFERDCVRSIYEDVDSREPYIVVEGCVSNTPPDYFTKGFYVKDFDELIVEPF